MTARPVPDELAQRWTAPALTDAGVRRDLRKYVSTRFDKAELIANTEALQRFSGPALVLWSPDGRVMPVEHGKRLAELMPRAEYREVPGTRVLAMLDEPSAVAQEMAAFLRAVHPG